MSQIRKLENFHILLWLLKDLSWLMFWRSLGLFMIFPTLTFALLITWRSRQIKSELFHNLAIVFWIIANSIWMIVEFFDLEAYRNFAAIPFAIGFALIFYYYFSAIWLPMLLRK